MPIFTKDKARVPAASPSPAGAQAPVRESESPPALQAAPESRFLSGALLWRLGTLGAGCLLGAGQLYGTAPLGLALTVGCPPGFALPAMVGALAGSLAFQPFTLGLKLAGALVAAVAGRCVAAQLGKKQYIWGSAAGCAALLTEQLTVSAVGPSAPGDTVQVLATALLAAGFGAAIHALPHSKPRGLCLWLAMAAVCAQRLTPLLGGGFAPGLMLAAGAGLCTAFAGSLEQSAVLAVAMAAAVTAAASTLSYAALAVALGTLGAAVLANGERWRCAGIFALGCGVGALAAPTPAGALWLCVSAGAGMLGFLACPPSLLRGIFPPPAPPVVSQTLGSAARRLAGVADSLSDIADTVNEVCERQLPPKGETYDFVVEYTARHVCQQCERRSSCWIRGYSTAVDGLYKLRGALDARGRVELEDLPGQLSVCIHPSDLCSAVTHGYRLWVSRRQTRARASLLRGALTEQYSAMASALAHMASRLGQAGLPDPRREAKVANLFSTLGLEPLECSATSDVAGRISVNVTIPRMKFTDVELQALAREVGRICRRDFDLPDLAQCRTVSMLRFGERPLFTPAFGLASRPAPPETVSGDACDQFCDRAGRAQMLLCDGMGTGKAAAVDGRMAAKLTAQLLRAGFAAESAARLVNVALGMKCADQESGATLDLLTVDLYTGRAGLFKAGAAPSFLVRDGVARVLEAPSLPMGVSDSVVGRSTALSLAEGDMVVLVSDGALCDGSDWLVEQLQLCARLDHDPDQVAKAVADSAVRRSGARQDDITVAVLRLDR